VLRGLEEVGGGLPARAANALAIPELFRDLGHPFGEVVDEDRLDERKTVVDQLGTLEGPFPLAAEIAFEPVLRIA
jgi:hypothetical protein